MPALGSKLASLVPNGRRVWRSSGASRVTGRAHSTLPPGRGEGGGEEGTEVRQGGVQGMLGRHRE